MTDYISREAVLAFADRVRYVKNEDVEAGIQGVLIFVRDEIPAADVREVVRGKWIFDNPLTADFMCDNCLERQIICTPFCPNCGADMRGEDDGT